MSDTRKLVLEIRSVSSSRSGLKALEDDPVGERNLKPYKNENIDTTYVFAAQMFNHEKGIIMGAVNSSISRYTRMSEDYFTENNINNLMSAAGKAVSIGASTLAGAKIGSVAGPVGAVIGAAIGATFSTMSHDLAYRNSLSQFYSSLNASNMQTEWAQKKAGLWDGGRGTEN